MENKRVLKIVDLKGLLQVCNGDQEKKVRYLNQFCKLVRERVKLLRQATLDNNLEGIRKEVHRMSPQAEFFGIHQVVQLKKVLEIEPVIFSAQELTTMIFDIISILVEATKEIDFVLLDESGKEIA